MFTRLPDLPWPRSLFAGDADVLEIPARQQLRVESPDLCICGKKHHQRYPRTCRSEYGSGFNVTYYCSDACKSSAACAESARMNGG